MTAIPRALPDLVAVMDSGSPDLIVSQQGLPDRLTTGGNLQTLSSSIHIPFGSYGLPESSAAYPSLLQGNDCVYGECIGCDNIDLTDALV